MFKDQNDLIKYVCETYPEVTDQRINEEHWDLYCPTCKVVRGFDVFTREIQGYHLRRGSTTAWQEDFYLSPKGYLFCCPVCKVFKVWLVFEFDLREADEGKYSKRYFRVTSLPSDGIEDIRELPAKPAALRMAYRQAVRAMDANAHLAAAAMFRRALQVITRELLGATPGNLANELKEVVGKSFNGATITHDFADIGYIVKEAGNQGAHPDRDPDLLDFTPQDADDLQQLFMELVSELFIIPEATKKAKADFLSRRKIEVR